MKLANLRLDNGVGEGNPVRWRYLGSNTALHQSRIVLKSCCKPTCNNITKKKSDQANDLVLSNSRSIEFVMN